MKVSIGLIMFLRHLSYATAMFLLTSQCTCFMSSLNNQILAYIETFALSCTSISISRVNVNLKISHQTIEVTEKKKKGVTC